MFVAETIVQVRKEGRAIDLNLGKDDKANSILVIILIWH